MLLKDNTNGSVKGRSMIYGKQSRVWKTKEKTDIPTAVNGSIMITAGDDDEEGIYLNGSYLSNTFI